MESLEVGWLLVDGPKKANAITFPASLTATVRNSEMETS
jgi:hypothetical protein